MLIDSELCGSDLSAFCRNATSESISLGTGIETSVSVVTIDSDLTSFVFFQKFLLFSSGLLFNVPGIDIYKVTLEDLGDYTFNIFQKYQKFLRLVSRYIITRNDHKEEIEEDVKEVLEVIKEERENAGTDVSDLERHPSGSATERD
jgi:hypothetical protein